MSNPHYDQTPFTWKIEKFSAQEEVFRSQEFTCAEATWALEMDPNHITDDGDREVSISLLKVSSEILNHDIFYRLCLKNKDGDSDYLNCCYQVVTGNGTHGIIPCTIIRDTLMKEMFSLLPNDTLTVFCELTAKKMEENLKGLKPLPEEEMIHLNTLSEDFGKLYRNRESCDVILKSKGNEIPAHKTILRARSAVFNKLLKNEIEVIDLSNLGSSTLKAMLSYIYTGIVPKLLWEKAIGLYIAGHKYELLELKKTCVHFIIQNLSREKFLSVAALQDKYKNSELREAIKQFFITNSIIITGTKEWENFKNIKSKLAQSLLNYKD